jgi:hypothetical protein
MVKPMRAADDLSMTKWAACVNRRERLFRLAEVNMPIYFTDKGKSYYQREGELVEAPMFRAELIFNGTPYQFWRFVHDHFPDDPDRFPDIPIYTGTPFGYPELHYPRKVAHRSRMDYDSRIIEYDDEEPDTNTDPTVIYFLPTNQDYSPLEVAKVSASIVHFGDGRLSRYFDSFIGWRLAILQNLVGRVKAEGRQGGKSKLYVSALEEYWPELSKTWELLNTELKRENFLDAQPTTSTARCDRQGKEENAVSRPSRQYLAWLRQNIVDCCNIDELRTLCFDMGIKDENLPASTLDGKARELVALCERRKIIPDLVNKLKQMYPQVSWEDKPE